MADESRMVQESNEDNNRLGRWVNVPPAMPDLRMCYVTDVPDLAHWGQQFNPEICVDNGGNAAAGAFVVWFRYGSGESDVCRWNVGGLAPAEEKMLIDCDFNVYPPCEWQLDIDPANSVQESDEDNNTFRHGIELIP
jgi:subtilase family serine protease